MSSIPNSATWTEFLNTYRNLPELWDAKSEIFKHRNRRKMAWNRLLEVYKQIDADANVDTLKKRLHNMKSCYRREVKKMENIERDGVREYTPNLWYFDMLDFLRYEDTQNLSQNTMMNVDKIELVDEFETSCESESVSMPPTNKKIKTSPPHLVETTVTLNDPLGRLECEDTKDEVSVYAQSWAVSFKKLSRVQQLYAKKAIEEILVLGQLDALSLHSVNVQPNVPSNTVSSSIPARPSRSRTHMYHESKPTNFTQSYASTVSNSPSPSDDLNLSPSPISYISS